MNFLLMRCYDVVYGHYIHKNSIAAKRGDHF